ncbi:hypothetical protein KA107_00550 [Candidatus Pacearchaeota archaeon]|nr:hypothetical protein [Candidatus Pacearchaeota archaeon]
MVRRISNEDQARNIEKYLTRDADKKVTAVDWKALAQADKEYRDIASDRAITQSPLEDAALVLHDEEVLTFSEEGTYWITDGYRTNLCPSTGASIPLYFVRKDDARGFAEAQYATVQYLVDLVKLKVTK